MSALLGDRITQALESVGISSREVSRWLGRPCHCDRRRQMVNQLELWVRRVLSGRSTSPQADLVGIMAGWESNPR